MRTIWRFRGAILVALVLTIYVPEVLSLIHI